MSLNIAHRGATQYEPENTIASFEKALEIGCDGIELDTRLDQNGEIVIFHDSKMDRVSKDGDRRSILEITHEELRQFNVPSLRDVLNWGSGKTHLYIEMKHEPNGHEGFTNQILDILVRGNHIHDQNWIISFHDPYIKDLKNRCPDLLTARTFRITEKGKAFSYVKEAQKGDLDGILLHIKTLKEDLVDLIREKELQLGIWGIKDNPKEVQHALNLKCDFLITDIPETVNQMRES